MSLRVTNPTDSPHLSRRLVEQANNSLHTRNGGGELRSCRGVISDAKGLAAVAGFSRGDADEGFALECVCRYVSRFLLGHSFGAFPAPGGTRSSASHSAPLRGLGSSQNKFVNHGKERLSNFFRAPPRKQTFGTWEPGPLAKLRPV